MRIQRRSGRKVGDCDLPSSTITSGRRYSDESAYSTCLCGQKGPVSNRLMRTILCSHIYSKATVRIRMLAPTLPRPRRVVRPPCTVVRVLAGFLNKLRGNCGRERVERGEGGHKGGKCSRPVSPPYSHISGTATSFGPQVIVGIGQAESLLWQPMSSSMAATCRPTPGIG